jgi:hypothetical protein
MPRYIDALAPPLAAAVGQVVRVEIAGLIGPEEAGAGQYLFRETSGGVLQNYYVPEQDLEFID